MSGSKKITMLFIVLAVIIGITVPTSASELSDITGTPYEGAVSRLVALGIITGYEDGTFKPEKSITRAEFAKITCYLLGLQNAANLSKGKTKFSDVPSDYWASGFINVVSEQGIIKGYQNGTFKPEAKITYAEAITMLVRSLGLAPVVDGKGIWPANYMTKASELGITEGLTSVSGTTFISRGNIAKLCWNTLTEDKWGVVEYTNENGIVYGSLNKSLLVEKYSDYAYLKDGRFEPKVFENMEVTGTQLIGGLGTNEIQLKYSDVAAKLNITAATDTPRKVSNNEIVIKAPDLDTFNLLGKKVDVMFGKDNEVVDIRVNSSKIFDGKVDEFRSNVNRIKIAGKEYAMATDPRIYVNTKLFSNLAEAEKAAGTATVKANAVLNTDGKISTLDMFIASTNALLGKGSGTKLFIVKEIRSNGDVISLKTGAAMFNLDNVTGTSSTNKKAIIVKNGKRVSKEAIKSGDVVTFIEVDAGTLYYIAVSDNSVFGKVTMISPDSSGYKLTVNSVGYIVKKYSDAMMTKNSRIEDAVVVDDSVTDYLNKEVTLTLDANGEIAYISSSVTASVSEQYGLLTRAIWESSSPDTAGKLNKYMSIRTSAGEIKVFTIKGDKYKTASSTVPSSALTEWNLDAAKNDKKMVAGTLVQYKLNADGTVNASDLVRVCRLEAGIGAENPNIQALAQKTNGLYVKVDTVNNDAKSITAGGTTYYYTSSDTVIFNTNTDTPSKKLDKVDGWDSLVNSSSDMVKGSNLYIVYNNETKIIKYLLIDVGSYLKSAIRYGVVTKTQYSGFDSSGSQEWKINIYTDGKEYVYTVANGVYDNTIADPVYIVAPGGFIRYTLDESGKFDGTAGEKNPSNYMAAKRANKIVNKGTDVGYLVKNITGNLITFNVKNGSSKLPISVSSDAKIYDNSGPKPIMGSLSDIKPGSMIKEVELYNGQYKIIVILHK